MSFMYTSAQTSAALPTTITANSTNSGTNNVNSETKCS